MTQLAFSAEELTWLAAAAGRRSFPAVASAELDDDGWAAVGRGLVARGILRDDVPAPVAGVGAMLGVILEAERSLWLTLTYAPGEGSNRAEILWFRGDDVVSQRPTSAGVHHIADCGSTAVDALLATALDVTSEGAAEPELTVSERELIDAMALSASAGAAAVADRFPDAAGYVEALADARRMVRLSARRGDADDDDRELALVESPRHGLWVERDATARHGSVVLQRATAADARRHIASLVATVV